MLYLGHGWTGKFHMPVKGVVFLIFLDIALEFKYYLRQIAIFYSQNFACE